MNGPYTHASLPGPRLAPFAAASAVAALLVGCGGGGFGDPPSKPLANEYGDSSRLCEVIGAATWEDMANAMSSGCQQPPDHSVDVTGVTIVAIDRFDETGKGAIGNYYAEDTTCMGKPYAGVTVFGPSFSPPDLRLANNDVVDVSGVITEFLGPSSGNFGKCRTLPEISGTLSFRFDGDGPPEPVLVQVPELKVYESARKYLGMLVKVPNLTLNGDATNSGGRFQADINVNGGVPQADVPKVTNELYDIEVEGPPLKDGVTFKSVTGVITYFYGFHLSPRSPADFEL